MNRTIFITGASSGLGSALAGLYAQAGDKVALIARREDRLEQLASDIRKAGGTALPLVCDVRNREAVHEVVKQCETELGPIDILIANAGVNTLSTAKGFDAGDLEWIFQVNVFGAAYCFEAVLPSMIKRKAGQLVGIGSLAGYRGLPGSLAYCASKSALITLMEGLRIELRRRQVAVTTICPGFVKTEMTSDSTNPMPFLVELEKATRLMYRAIERHASEYTFPWQLASAVKAGRLIPNVLYDRLIGGLRAS